MYGERVLQGLVCHHVENRRESFGLDRVCLILHFDYGGTDIGASRGDTVGYRLAARDDAAFATRALNRRHHFFARTVIDQRAYEYVRVAWIADPEPGIGLCNLLNQLASYRFVHDQPPQRRAALPGSPNGGENNGANRHAEIGGRSDDHRVIAAEFEDWAAPTRRHLRADDGAHAGRAGRRQDRDALGRHQRFACLSASYDQLREPIRRLFAETPKRARHDLHCRQRGERRLLGRFPDHRVAAHQRERSVP